MSQTKVCESCNGEGYWMAPVYHNERVREQCGRCGGTGCVRPPEPPKYRQPFPKAED